MYRMAVLARLRSQALGGQAIGESDYSSKSTVTLQV